MLVALYTEPLTCSRRLFTFYHSVLPGAPGTCLIDLRMMKGWVDLGATPAIFGAFLSNNNQNWFQ